MNYSSAFSGMGAWQLNRTSLWVINVMQKATTCQTEDSKAVFAEAFFICIMSQTVATNVRDLESNCLSQLIFKCRSSKYMTILLPDHQLHIRIANHDCPYPLFVVSEI